MRTAFAPQAKPWKEQNLAEFGQLTRKGEKISMGGHSRTERCVYPGLRGGLWDKKFDETLEYSCKIFMAVIQKSVVELRALFGATIE